MTNYLWLATFSAILAIGQLLFKEAAFAMHGNSVPEGLVKLASTPVFYLALALYGAATLLWIWILSRVPLSQAYPWVALAMAAVPILAAMVYHERVGLVYWVGIALVILGVSLTQYGSQAS